MLTNTGQADLFSSENKSFQVLLDWLRKAVKFKNLCEFTASWYAGCRKPANSPAMPVVFRFRAGVYPRVNYRIYFDVFCPVGLVAKRT